MVNLEHYTVQAISFIKTVNSVIQTNVNNPDDLCASDHDCFEVNLEAVEMDEIVPHIIVQSEE